MAPLGLFHCLAAMLSVTLLVAMVTSTKHCSEPSDVALLDMYRNLRDGAFDVSKVTEHSKGPTPHIIPINGRSAFKTELRLCQCSSKDEINFDPQRVPKAIPQSLCERGNPKTFGNGNSTWHAECRDVYHEMYVYRRSGKCKNNTFVYNLYKEKIKVGCSCYIRPHMGSTNFKNKRSIH